MQIVTKNCQKENSGFQHRRLGKLCQFESNFNEIWFQCSAIQGAQVVKIEAHLITLLRGILAVVYMYCEELHMPLIKLCQFLSNFYEIKSGQSSHNSTTLVKI